VGANPHSPITDQSMQQARQDGWWKAGHPNARKRVNEAWERPMRGQPLRLEFRYQRPDGAVRWAHVPGLR